MTVLAVTGHMGLTDATVPLVEAELRQLLADRAKTGQVTGMSCIARGADTLFAEAVVETGGALVVVIPSEDYRRAVVKPDHAPAFDRLVAQAAEVITLPFEHASREAYESANELLLERADVLVAVWDGEPPTGRGGTGDMVEHAQAVGVEVLRVWPQGSARS